MVAAPAFLLQTSLVFRAALFIGILLVAFAVIGFIVGTLKTFIAKKEQVHNKTFENQEVPLDGKAFTHCTFDNVTFVYKGQRTFYFDGATNKVSGRNIIKGDNPRIEVLMNLYKSWACSPRWLKNRTKRNHPVSFA